MIEKKKRGRPVGSIKIKPKENKQFISAKTKQLRNEIFGRFELSAPWLFTQLGEKTKRDLQSSVDRIIEKNLNN
jgi:hypothetical protein